MNNADDPTALRTQIVLMQQLQEMLLYMVTHELRTPVMTIMGFADILISDGQSGIGTAQSQPHLERIRSAAQRQNAIIQGLQQIAHIQQQPLQLTTVNLSELVRAYATKFVPGPHRMQISVNEVSPTQADCAMIDMALHSLISIVTMISQRSSAPSLEFGRSESLYFLRGSVNGFDPGQDQTLPLVLRRLQSSTEFPGAGMQLLIATTIIQRHGGDLRFSSGADQKICFEFGLN